MARVPRFRKLLKSDFEEAPEWLTKLLQQLNDTFGDIVLALGNRLTRSENLLSQVENMSFLTAAVAASTFPLIYKNKMGANVQNAWVSMFSKKSGAALSGPWSVTIVSNQRGEIEVSFQGLENNTDYVGKLILEG